MERRLGFALGTGVLALVGSVYLSGFLALLLLKLDAGQLTWSTYLEYLRALHLPEVRPYARIIRTAGYIGLGAPLLAWLALLVLILKPSRRPLHGDARFAGMTDLSRKGMFNASPDGVIVGRYKGRLLRLAGQQFAILAAPTRPGKGVGVVVPNLLEYRESVVVLDIKQENFQLTSGWRASQGQEVFLFNPFAEDRRSHRWNPLAYVSADPAFRVSDLPFVGREEWEIEHRHNTFNRLLQTLRAPDYANVAFWVHDIRRRRSIRDGSRFGQPFNQLLSDQYYAVLSAQKIMQNELYLTMVYRPVLAGRRFIEKTADANRLRLAQDQAVAKLLELAGNVEAVLRDYAPQRLGMYQGGNGVVFSETLELFGFIVNRIEEPVPVLHAPIADYLAVSRHTFASRGGDYIVRTPEGTNHFGAMLNIKEYTDATWPGILNGLKYLDFEYVITHSFSPMGRQDALKALDRTKGMMISSGDKAVSQIVELDRAMDELASGNFVLGEYHLTMALYADSQAKLSQQIAAARAELANAGFVSAKEDLAVAASFYSQLPANWKYRTRPANLSSLNFLGLSPLHNFACGKKDGNPWGECVTTLQTTNGQPYYFNFHATHPAEQSFGEKAIANTLVIGKSGTGKTALINFLLSQVQKLDPAPTIFFFDKDRGAEIFVRASGGNYLALENGRPTGFNPFHCDRSEGNVQFLADLVKVLAGKDTYTAREEEDIHRAVEGMLDTPMHLRSMTNFQKSLPNMGDDGLFARIRKWTAGNSLGWVFDNPVDTIDLQKANIIGFDYTEVIDNPEVRVPVIGYLLHRLESLIDGRRLIYVMDEFWKILEGDGGLKSFAKNKQKTIRKQNGLGIFATQSPEDALRSDIAAALIEQTATMVLLPNPNASRVDYIEGLKLTDAEYRVVQSLDERSRCFLVKQGHASNVCQLDLRGMDDVLAVISASTDNIDVMHSVIRRQAEVHGVEVDDLRPDQWITEFQARRKGSGRTAEKAGEAVEA